MKAPTITWYIPVQVELQNEGRVLLRRPRLEGVGHQDLGLAVDGLHEAAAGGAGAAHRGVALHELLESMVRRLAGSRSHETNVHSNKQKRWKEQTTETNKNMFCKNQKQTAPSPINNVKIETSKNGGGGENNTVNRETIFNQNTKQNNTVSRERHIDDNKEYIGTWGHQQLQHFKGGLHEFCSFFPKDQTKQQLLEHCQRGIP